jgi:peptidoglycan/xylan/chitin deacetylase (PgdA/CDA1 family)
MTLATPDWPASARDPAVPRALPGSFVALMYHNVVADGEAYADLSPSATSYFVSRSSFATQLARLYRGDAACMNVAALDRFYDAGAAPAAGRVPSRHHVLLTFDDGWRGGVEVGGPLVEQHGHQAIVFVTTDFVDKPHFLTRGELGRLDARVFRVGSHARTHRMLSLLRDDDIRAELSHSKRFLEDATGRAVDALSIPSGAVDHRVRRIAAECGYRFVFDSAVRPNRRGDSPLAIARVAVMHDTSTDAFDRYVTQRVTRERLRRAILQAPKRIFGLPRYERLRRRLLGEKPAQRVTHTS